MAAGAAMVWSAPAVVAPDAALGVPQVDVGGSGLGVVSLRVGMRDVQAGGLVAITLHNVSLSLRPVGGGTPIRMTGAEATGEWPTATYRITLARRGADGATVPAGQYRVVATAKGPGGATLASRSAPFHVR